VTSSNFVAVGSLDTPGQTDTASVPETGASSGVLVSLAEFAGRRGRSSEYSTLSHARNFHRAQFMC
jgi:hypothetical protein